MTMLREYGKLCAWALARAHARSGDAAKIAGYMGSNTTFDDVIGASPFDIEDKRMARQEDRQGIGLSRRQSDRAGLS